MLTLLTIIHYLALTVTDVLDKFLITKRKIEPVKYTFFTVVTGALLLLIWPWVYKPLPFSHILLALFSGIFFSLVFYVFFKALSEGEVSRVIPFIFGIVPVFDILISSFLGKINFTTSQVAAIFLLVPGALFIAYTKNGFSKKHLSLKILSAFLFSCYYALWQYAANQEDGLNTLLWNRLGAAAILIFLLLIPFYKKKIFATEKIQKRKHTTGLFIFKQMLGGVDFLFFSYLLTYGSIAVINSLQGVRYVFLFLASLVLSKKYRHILEEDSSKHMVTTKTIGLVLVGLGTLILFL
jgi:uncharacterized membrane protein